MGEVRYSINGKYFKDYGVYVSSSLGLLDALKRKPIKTYDWPEYHGESLDLSSPKYEAREIVLNCFVTGDNYEEMFINFRNIVMSEFQKSGTQRLLVEAFGLKALPYEVYLIDDVKLLKEFKNSKTVGVFQLKLIEPNPIKKVLYLTDNTLNLSYNSSKETEIFFVNGEKTTAKGNVSLSGKVLASRNVGSYGYNGRNYLFNSVNVLSTIRFISIPTHYLQNLVGKEVVFSFDFMIKETGVLREILIYPYQNSGISIGHSECFTPTTKGVYERFSIETNIKDYGVIQGLTNGEIAFYDTADENDFSIKNVKIEIGNKATDWTPAPEEEKYIIIAGDIDGITNLTTNATVLWEKL